MNTTTGSIGILLLILLSSSCHVVSITPVASLSELPESFTWRDIDGVDYTTGIKDQSPAPTCEAYAFCAALETKMQYQLKELYTPDLSENHLFFYAGGSIAQGGVHVPDAAEYLIDHGVPDEGCNPDPHRDFDSPYDSLPGWENRTVHITEWQWVDHENISAMKHALIDHGPLVICIGVWQNFFNYFGGIYRPQGERVGGHVVTIVGYDDSTACWIVKNSWGSKWGEKGWFRMAYDADMIAEWNGPGTGVMYIEGVYGNLKPDVPRISLDKPVYSHTYLFGVGIPTLVKKVNIQTAAARIIGKTSVSVSAENTKTVEFFVDSLSQAVDTETPFSYTLKVSRGLHTLLVKATDDQNVSSIAIVDFYVIL